MFDTCDVCKRQIISMTRKSRNLIEFKKFENRIQSIAYSIRLNFIIVRLHFLSILLRLYWRDFVLIWLWFIWYDVVNMFFKQQRVENLFASACLLCQQLSMSETWKWKKFTIIQMKFEFLSREIINHVSFELFSSEIFSSV